MAPSSFFTYEYLVTQIISFEKTILLPRTHLYTLSRISCVYVYVSISDISILFHLSMSSAPGYNSMCDLSGSTTGNYKALCGRPHRGRCPPHTRLGVQPLYFSFWKELQFKDTDSPHTHPRANHTYIHMCITGPGTSFKELLMSTSAEALPRHLHRTYLWMWKWSWVAWPREFSSL